MTALDKTAEDTCSKFLTAQHLKEICRRRGFSAPSGSKDALARFIAVRLLDPFGAGAAMNSLDERELVLLHRIALADRPVSLDDLHPVLSPGKPHYSIDYRALFRKVADGLLIVGVILVEENHSIWSSCGSRFEHIAFVFPEVHQRALPPFPVETQPLGKEARSGDSIKFCLAALRNAAHPSSSGNSGKDDLLERVSAAITFKEDRLNVAGSDSPDVTGLLKLVRSIWTGLSSGAKEGTRSKNVLSAADHILAHLPAGEGVAIGNLNSALAGLGFKTSEASIEQFCLEGVDAGLLMGDEKAYAARPTDRHVAGTDRHVGGTDRHVGGTDRHVAGDGQAILNDGPLVFTETDDGIDVDLDQTGLAPLLELAAVSKSKPEKSKLRLSPDILFIGRNVERSGSSSVPEEVKAASLAYRKAVEHVEKNHGKIVLHEGLAIFRIEDSLFRATLSHSLGDNLRLLGGSWLAAPTDLISDVEKLARKEGFSLRRVS